MFNADDLIWIDFEVFGGALDLKAAGAFRYVAEASTHTIVLSYAIGNAPALTWHADGAILDWNCAPNELRAAYERRKTFAAWNASFDAAVWNYATLGFPFLAPERVIDPMVQAGVSNLPTDLEHASRYLGGPGKQKDGKALIRMFSIEGANPRECPAEWKRFLAYARQDVEAMRDVYRKTRPLPHEEWPPILGVRAYQPEGRSDRYALRAQRRNACDRRCHRHRPPADRAHRRGCHPSYAGETDRDLDARHARRRGNARGPDRRRS